MSEGNKKIRALDDEELINVSGGDSEAYDDDELHSFCKFRVIKIGGAAVHSDADSRSGIIDKIRYNKVFTCPVWIPRSGPDGKAWIYVSTAGQQPGYVCQNDLFRLS